MPRYARVALLSACALLLASCATTAPADPAAVLRRHKALLRFAVHQAVARFVQRRPALAPVLAQLAREAQAGLTGEVLDVTALVAAIETRLAQHALSAADRLAVQALVALLTLEVQGVLERQGIQPAEQWLWLVEVLGWVRESVDG